MHTGDQSTDTKFEVQFRAMLVNLPEVANGEKRYITAGAEYGNSEYIWIGQAEITVKNPLTAMSVSGIKHI